jgi:hypothetical protein
MGIEIVHVRFPGDWEALYVDGALAVENHTVGVGDVCSVIEGRTIDAARSEWRDINLTEEFTGRAPDEYRHLVEADEE